MLSPGDLQSGQSPFLTFQGFLPAHTIWQPKLGPLYSWEGSRDQRDLYRGPSSIQLCPPTAGNQTSQSIPCIPAPFLPHLPTVQPLAELGAGLAAGGPGADAVPLPAVSMFLEESSLGRQHWRQNLALLLQRLATTLRWVLQSQPAPGSTWGYLVIKVRARLGSGARISTCRNWPSDVQRDVTHGAALNGCSWGIAAFSEVRNTNHLCGTSCSSRPASRSSRHCQRMWPRWCGAHQERVRPCRASWDCCWRWFGGRCVQPWEGMELPVPRSRAALSFPGAFPIPLPKASLQTSLPNVWHV